MGFVEEELLRSGHSAGDDGCGGAVGSAESDFDEVAGALGDVGVEVVDAHLDVFGLVVAGADDLIAAGDVVGDPLDSEVVAVVENFDLGVVALGGFDGEDVAVDELVGGVVVAVDGGASVGEALEGGGGEGVEVDGAEIDDPRGVLDGHLAENGGHLLPEDVSIW